MKVGILFSGGKDSVYAAYLAKKQGHEIVCLISVYSENEASYMFHTPSISWTKEQAKAMEIPLIIQKTKGEKEKELEDLEKVIKKAIDEFGIEGVVTGAIASVYQATRIQKICNKLGLECFNPLWQKDESKYLDELIKENFDVIIVGVFAYPLDESFLGKKIDFDFIKKIKELNKKYSIHVAGEGGEFESFVLNCPLFKRKLEIVESEKKWEKDSGRLIIKKIRMIK